MVSSRPGPSPNITTDSHRCALTSHYECTNPANNMSESSGHGGRVRDALASVHTFRLRPAVCVYECVFHDAQVLLRLPPHVSTPLVIVFCSYHSLPLSLPLFFSLCVCTSPAVSVLTTDFARTSFRAGFWLAVLRPRVRDTARRGEDALAVPWTLVQHRCGIWAAAWPRTTVLRWCVPPVLPPRQRDVQEKSSQWRSRPVRELATLPNIEKARLPGQLRLLLRPSAGGGVST